MAKNEPYNAGTSRNESPVIEIDKNAPDSAISHKYQIEREKEFEICRRYSYTPESVKQIGNIALIIANHGTWGRETKAFFDDFDESDQGYRHIKRFASWYATCNKIMSELISIKWSGFRTDEARIRGAEFLLEYLNKTPEYKNVDLVIINHSHGCNLAHYFSQIWKGKAIKLIVDFACPERPEKVYKPENVEQVIHHTSHDFVARIGSVPEGQGLKFVKKHFPFAAAVTTGIILHIVPGVDKKIAMAVNNVVLATAPNSIKDAIDIAKLIRSKKNNALKPQSKKIIVGLDVRDNDYAPSHTTIIKIARFLPEIITQLQNEHIDNYAKSGSFHLNVTDKKDSTGKIIDSRIALKLKNKGKIRDVLKFTQFNTGQEVINYAADNKILNKYFKECEKENKTAREKAKKEFAIQAKALEEQPKTQEHALQVKKIETEKQASLKKALEEECKAEIEAWWKKEVQRETKQEIDIVLEEEPKDRICEQYKAPKEAQENTNAIRIKKLNAQIKKCEDKINAFDEDKLNPEERREVLEKHVGLCIAVDLALRIEEEYLDYKFFLNRAKTPKERKIQQENYEALMKKNKAREEEIDTRIETFEYWMQKLEEQKHMPQKTELEDQINVPKEQSEIFEEEEKRTPPIKALQAQYKAARDEKYTLWEELEKALEKSDAGIKKLRAMQEKSDALIKKFKASKVTLDAHIKKFAKAKEALDKKFKAQEKSFDLNFDGWQEIEEISDSE
ncbi:MAG: hypothetical protein WC707_00965 [Candidatus Babeliaceae bacterium]|jgi:hypothetical protein